MPLTRFDSVVSLGDFVVVAAWVCLCVLCGDGREGGCHLGMSGM